MSTPKATFQAKVDWLILHREVWVGWPVAGKTDRYIIQAMKEAGLISVHTRLHSVGDIGRLIATAKRQIHEKTYQQSSR
jgi:hypothetical protein